MYKSYLGEAGGGGGEGGGGGGEGGENYSTLAPRVVERRGEERKHSFRPHTIRNIAQCQHCTKVFISLFYYYFSSLIQPFLLPFPPGNHERMSKMYLL